MPELRSLHFLFLEFAQASLAHPQIKNAPVGGMGLGCGERGIRTPGPVTVNGFQDRRNRPLCHLSAANVHPKAVLEPINPPGGLSGPKGRDPELIEGRLYRRGGLGHRASGQVHEAQNQEDGRKE